MPLSIEDEILVLCARTALNPSDITQLQKLIDQDAFSVEKLLERALYHRVSAYLHKHLVNAPELQECIDAKLRSELQDRIAVTLQEERLKQWAIDQIWLKSNELGLQPIALKGMALTDVVYPSGWIREYRDLDFLICEDEIHVFHGLLIDLGFQQGRFIPEYNLVIPVSSDELMLHSKNGRPHDLWPYYLPVPEMPGYALAVEAHVSLFDEKACFNVPFSKLNKDCFTVEKKEQKRSYLSFHDLLISLFSNVFNDYSSIEYMKVGCDLRLRSYADIRELVVNHKDRVDWSKFVQRVRECKLEFVVYQMSYFIEELYKETILPPEANGFYLSQEFKNQRLAIHDMRILSKPIAIGYWESDFQSVFSDENRYEYAVNCLFLNCINTYHSPVRKLKQDGVFPQFVVNNVECTE